MRHLAFTVEYDFDDVDWVAALIIVFSDEHEDH